MTRMQNMFAETNALLSEIKVGFGTFKGNAPYMSGVAIETDDVIGVRLRMSELNGNISSEMDVADYADEIKDRLVNAEDKEACVRSLWDRLAFYDSANKEQYEKAANTYISYLRNGANIDQAMDIIAQRYAEQTHKCLKAIADDNATFRNTTQKHTASFAQVIMSVVFSGGEAVMNMFESNFSGADKLSLGASAKFISREIGGGFFESLSTTTNRLVKGAKVLGENDDKNTNVDNIPLPEEEAEEEENQINLDV